jgi:hypothetical protein
VVRSEVEHWWLKRLGLLLDALTAGLARGAQGLANAGAVAEGEATFCPTGSCPAAMALSRSWCLRAKAALRSVAAPSMPLPIALCITSAICSLVRQPQIIQVLQNLPSTALDRDAAARQGLKLRQVFENQSISLAFSFVVSFTSAPGLCLSKSVRNQDHLQPHSLLYSNSHCNRKRRHHECRADKRLSTPPYESNIAIRSGQV